MPARPLCIGRWAPVALLHVQYQMRAPPVNGPPRRGSLDWQRWEGFDAGVSSMSSTLTTLLEMCARKFNRSPQELRPDDDVFESLGIDSVQVLSLLSELELKFDVEIPDYELRDVRSFAQLAECIERRL